MKIILGKAGSKVSHEKKDMKILLGKHGNKPAYLDVDSLLRTRLLVQGNSGRGKSWLLRRLTEELFGKVQVIIIDPEGEFATLREKFGYVLVGKGGETPADPRSAALVAHKLLELRASAVCDLYEMKPFARHEWVRNFCDALIDAPKNLWHSCVIIVDEAHTFCPEKGAGESVAAESVIGLATRGRKRGYALVLATQRLGKLRKDAAAELLNVMIGGTFIDIDRKRAADALGVYGKDQHDFFDQIKVLKRGMFFSLGPAISDERILLEVGDVRTTHPEAGSSKHSAEPPPAPEAIAKLLPKLSDLPKAAEEKARTEAEYKNQIRDLKSQLAMAHTKVASRDAALAVAEGKKKGLIDHGYIKNVTQLLREEREYSKKLGDYYTGFFKKVREAFGHMLLDPPERKPSKKAWEVDTSDQPQVQINIPVAVPYRERPRQNPPQYAEARRPAPVENNGDLTGPEKKILVALAQLRSIDKDTPPKEMVAGWAGYSPIGGAFGNPLGALRSKGFVQYPSPGVVQLTPDGLSKVGEQPVPDREEMQRRILEVCSGPERKILAALLDHGAEEISKAELAERSGYSVIGGAFGNPLGALRTKGFLDYPRPGIVKVAEWLFL